MAQVIYETDDDPSDALLDDDEPEVDTVTAIRKRERSDGGWGPVFLLACALLVFGLLLCVILISLQLFFSDSEPDGDDDGDGSGGGAGGGGTYGSGGGGGGGGSGGSSGGGGAPNSVPRQATQTAVTSAPVQQPAAGGKLDPHTSPGRPPTAPPVPHIPGVHPSPSLPTPKDTPVPQPQLPTKPTHAQVPPSGPSMPKVTRPPPLQPSTPKATGAAPTSRPTKPITRPPPLPPTTTPTTPLAPLVQRPPTLASMICTVDSESSMEVPPDGVCDFIFYDSLREPFERLGQPSRGNFKTFQSLAAKGRKTQFGVSIFAVDISQFLAHLNRPAATAWAKEKLWNHNIYHWGVMNMHQTITGVPGYFENALFTLKVTSISFLPRSYGDRFLFRRHVSCVG